ncbi:fasciclin domain-containing protein [Chitinophaga niabensis]|uniref:Uncaracterized surface protein containing fasciclin (FAS1) repeats n=1 Tax=Chitinophaga niabensis TaxID=536979 RepID=A0A1N6D069_9BACT|nr:fasciclin domain-containing protein [Chitinophaga niabensis]SIN64228.1 Uncaracterized surface protein containing fasciclin (FAS1) repeats [Chitinophaga niabensis]
MSNITQVVNTDKYLKTLKKGVHASDLDQLLSSRGPFTFFAPNDIAFEKLENGMMEGLLEKGNKQQLTDLMNNHIVNGKILFKDLKNGDKLNTLGGTVLAVEVQNGKVSIGGAVILEREARITNGTIHSTDTVFVKS